MSKPRKVADTDRLFVRDGRKNHRRKFSRTEVRWGAVVLVGLVAVAAWVAWKGAHPDPTLFEAAVDTGPPPRTPVVVDAARPPVATSGGPGGADGTVAPATATDRAPFPADLAAPAFQEGPVSHFDATNLYVKINGREDYYKSYGFQKLHWVSLAATASPSTTVDVELFDLGTAANALGAYAGERPPDASPHVESHGMWHRARNATFSTVGRYYARLVGADESEPVLAQLEHARRALAKALPAEPLPWGYTLFTGGMGLDPGRVAFVPENAFSFGFARNVYTARLGEDDLEGFVVPAPDEAAARALAGRFAASFREYGEDGGTANGHTWARDRYLSTLSTAESVGIWVLGVRGAAAAPQGAQAIEKLRQAVRDLPPEITARARTESAAAAAESPETPAPPAEDGGYPSSGEPGS